MDTSKIIDSNNSHLAINLLMMGDLKLTEYEKILMVNHWNMVGKPESHELPLIEALGFDWDTYMNPFLIKLFNLPFDKLLVDRSNLESLEDPRYRGIMEAIFMKKLENLENEVSKSGYVTNVYQNKHSSQKQSLVLNISSRNGKYELFNFSAGVEGYKFIPNIRLFNRPESQTHLLSEASITHLKGIIYYMTENPNWDKSLLPKSLDMLRFDSFILNEMAKAIIKKYYTPEFESKFKSDDDKELDIEDEDPVM